MESKFKIYTKTGDDGTSGLIGGTRVQKFDERLEAYGTIDELNSWIGLIRSTIDDEMLKKVLMSVQNDLFIIGSHLATDETKSDLKKQLPFSESEILLLENEIDRMQESLPMLKNFILPGGSVAANYAHIARTVCRRAERRISQLNNSQSIENNLKVFVNRLSDYLFVLSRYINFNAGIKETFWVSENS